jgi:hypothetical protein
MAYQSALVPFLSNIAALSLLSRVALAAVFSVPAAPTLLTLYTGHNERRGSMSTYQQFLPSSN